MDPLSVIVAALVTGASAGVSDSVKNAVASAYGKLRDLLKKRLQDGNFGTDVLEPQLHDVRTWEQSLKEQLGKAGLGDDKALVMSAWQVLELGGYQANVSGGSVRYQTNFHGSVGTAVVGDNSEVTVTIKKDRGP